MEHKRNPDKEYWTEAVVFTTSNNSFEPTEISYLENKFCNLAIEADRYILKNGNDPSLGHITEEKESELEEFVDYAKLIMGTLGHKIFVPLNKHKSTLEPLVEQTDIEIELFLSNGVNIKDSLVKHIVIPFTTISVVKQLIGRKRMMDNETVNIHFPDVPYKTIKKRYHNCIKDYMEIIGFNINLLQTAEVQLNHLTDDDISKYYYLSPVLINSQQSNFLQRMLNFPAMEKLYFDTCFCIFALHRMNPELENPSDFVKILLTHLDIENKHSDAVNISTQAKEEKEIML